MRQQQRAELAEAFRVESDRIMVLMDCERLLRTVTLRPEDADRLVSLVRSQVEQV